MYNVTVADLKGKIKDFPIAVVQKMVDLQEAAGNKPRPSVFAYNPMANALDGGFSWHHGSSESEASTNFWFWYAIIVYHKFNVFFNKYPKRTKTRQTNKKL